MTQNDANPNLRFFEQFPCFAPFEILITWSHLSQSRLLSHSSRLLSRYRTENTKIEKFTQRSVQNTKKYQNRPSNGGER